MNSLIGGAYAYVCSIFICLFVKTNFFAYSYPHENVHIENNFPFYMFYMIHLGNVYYIFYVFLKQVVCKSTS